MKLLAAVALVAGLLTAPGLAAAKRHHRHVTYRIVATTPGRWKAAPARPVATVTRPQATRPTASTPAPTPTSPGATTPATTSTPATTTSATTTTASTTTTTPTPPPSRSGVELSEYRVHPTHDPLAAGSVTLNVSNIGQDDHDLVLEDASGDVLDTTPTIKPGKSASITDSLAPGKYRIYCALLDHASRGMDTTFTVVATR